MTAPRYAWVAALPLAALLAGCTPVNAPETAGASTASSATAVHHWPYRTVWVEDHTSAAWPVTTAVRQWDAGTPLAVRYGPCRTGAGCIRVYADHEPGPDSGGVTDSQHKGRLMIAATVHLDQGAASDLPEDRLFFACHEIGHGLGLPHSADPHSCMYPEEPTFPVTHPSRADFAALNGGRP